MSSAAFKRLAVLALLACTACSTDARNISRTLDLAFRGGSLAASAALNPNYRYLRAVVGERPALLVLGYVDPAPDSTHSAPIEVWYSGEGEVIRLQAGRIVGTSGLSTDWRSVSAPGAPLWASLPPTAEPGQRLTSYERKRDESAYRAGIIDHISLFAIAPPHGTQLAGLAPESLQWFEERAEPIAPPADSAFAIKLVSRFALRHGQGATEVVYAEHCLSAKLCMSLQRWPAH